MVEDKQIEAQKSPFALRNGEIKICQKFVAWIKFCGSLNFLLIEEKRKGYHFIIKMQS